MINFRSVFLCLGTFFFISTLIYGHSGKIAFAYPLSEIKIDGKLNDWPKNIERYEINNILGSPGNTIAFFRIGYNLLEQNLYVAVEVKDNSNIKSNSNNDIWWNPEDKQILYLDFDHNPNKGSGVVGIAASQSGIIIRKVHNNWDPFNSVLSADDIQVKVEHRKGTTVYEWQIHLGTDLKSNKSIGLDFMISDVDLNAENTNSLVWSPGGAKIAMPFRLGDIMLLEKGVTRGRIEGVISLNNAALSFPQMVKIVSEASNIMWVTVNIDSTGHYKAELPDGTYRVSSVSKSVNVTGSIEKNRVDELKNRLFEVSGNNTTIVDSLKLDSYSEPKFLIPKKGLLFDVEKIDLEEIDQFVETYKNYFNIPGISLALIKDGKLIYNHHFGVESTITQKPVSDSSIFEIASVSKTFFAFAVHRLVERGTIDIDRPLFEYLPFEQIQHDNRAKLITARYILSHQSGLPNWLWGSPYGWKNNKKGELLFTPGTKYQYSGEGYQYLSRVIEKITKKDIETIIKEEVYQPLGIENSSFFAIDRLKPNIVVGHSEDYPMFWDLNRGPWVAGSMYSNTEDMSKFIISMMEGKGLSKESYQRMFIPQVENEERFMHFFGGHKQSHSLGFEIEDTPNGQIIHHGGNNGDFQARIAMHLDAKVGFIILTNNNNGFLLDLALQELLFSGRNSN